MRHRLFSLLLIVGLVIGLHGGDGFAAEEGGHDHGATPHGGQVRELGEYHVEFVVEEHGKIAVYLLDGNLKPLTAKNAEGFITLKVGEKYKKVDLKRSKDESHLEAAVDLHDMHEFEAGIRLTISGKAYSNVMFTYSAHDAIPHKHLKEIFPDAHSFDAKHADLSAKQIAAIENELKGYDAANAKVGSTEKEVHLFIAKNAAHKNIGAVAMLSIVGPDKAKIQGLVGVDAAGRVAKVVLMEHRDEDHHHKAEHHHEEAHYHEAETATFLKQFVGKTVKSDLRIGQEIKAAAVAAGVKKALLVWNAVKDHGHGHDH